MPNNSRGERQDSPIRGLNVPSKAPSLPTTVVGLIGYIIDGEERTKRACLVIGSVAVIMLIAIVLVVYSLVAAGIASLAIGVPAGLYRLVVWRRCRNDKTSPRIRPPGSLSGRARQSGEHSVTGRAAKSADRRPRSAHGSERPRKSRPTQGSTRQRRRKPPRPKPDQDASEAEAGTGALPGDPWCQQRTEPTP